MTTHLPEKLTTMPDIPKEFGEDGGHFYRYYDELADELDEDLVNRLKAQVDGILIFAGLFAGVNTAFLAFTLPQLSADPADDTNALLLQIALGGNGSIASAADLPSASFMPPSDIYRINVLFSVSLTLALFSSFLAVLGQQWIVYYRKRGGGGPNHQRWEQVRRFLGAKRWRLELVLDDLVPGLLQLGLVIFCIAFALYLGTLSQSLNRVIGLLLCVAAVTILAMSTGSAFDPWCPFKQPLSRVARFMVVPILATALWLKTYGVGMVKLTASHIINAIWRMVFFWRSSDVANQLPRQIGTPFNDLKILIIVFARIYSRVMSAGIRSPENSDDLKMEALKRVIRTYEDRNVLFYVAVNLRVIHAGRVFLLLRTKKNFCTVCPACKKQQCMKPSTGDQAVAPH